MACVRQLKFSVPAIAIAVLIVLSLAAPASAAASWCITGGAISAVNINALVVDGMHNVLYAAVPKGVWRCTNPDTAPKWVNTGGAMSKQHARCLAYDGVRNRLYSGTDSGLWTCKNPNGSPVWSKMGGPPTLTLAYDNAHNKLYAGSKSQGVWRCDNPDTTHEWKRLGGIIKDSPIYSIAYDEVLEIIYAGAGLGETMKPSKPDVWRCKNPISANPVWNHTGLNWTADCLAIDTGRNLLFAGTSAPYMNTGDSSGLHRCSKPDTAPVWTTFEEPSLFDINAVEVDTKQHVLYFAPYVRPQPLSPGERGDGVWYGPTSSAGDWTSTDEGLSDIVINDLCFNGKRGILYAATGSGVWRYGGTPSAFYFAEGTCRPGFDTYFTIQNPGDIAAYVRITYMKGDGDTENQDLIVERNSRATVSARDKLGEGDDPAHDFSARVECTNGQSIIAERPMYFNYKGSWTGGHDILGATAPASTYYFAEGSCRSNFDTYFCIQNPGASAAQVKITYMKGDNSTVEKTVTVNPQSRATVSAKEALGQGDDSVHDFSAMVETTNGTAIVCERPMYFNYNGVWTGGSDVIGALVPANVFYFAEGTCRPGFDPYLCIMNPWATDFEAVITYFKGDGTTHTQKVTIGQSCRTTVSVKAELGEGNDAAHDFSCRVESSGSLLYPPIVCERPMYFNYKGAWDGGHDVVGAISPETTFYFAEGTCRPGFDSYLCIQNPGEEDADVTITYMKGDGTTDTQTLTVLKNARSTVSPKDKLGEGDGAAFDFSAKVECTNGQKILCERPMYFNYNGVWTGGSDVIGLH